MPKKMPDHVREWFREHGRKGGEKYAATTTKKERSARAAKAAKARWGKKEKK